MPLAYFFISDVSPSGMTQSANVAPARSAPHARGAGSQSATLTIGGANATCWTQLTIIAMG
jgi:hypothetical protein